MKPILQALILAEHVNWLADGRVVIFGTFNTYRLGNTPPIEEEDHGNGKSSVTIRGGQVGSPYAYVSLTDVVDGTKVTLQFVSLSKNRVVFKQDVTLKCDNRLETVEVISALPPLSINKAGTYAFEMTCEGEIIGSCRVLIEDAAEESEGS